jgi:hypothetical protein
VNNGGKMELKQEFSDTVLFKLQSKQNQTLITHEFEVSTWVDALAQFKDFLRGTGYSFDGHFDLVEEE